MKGWATSCATAAGPTHPPQWHTTPTTTTTLTARASFGAAGLTRQAGSTPTAGQHSASLHGCSIPFR